MAGNRSTLAERVHLVGSVPLRDTETVFRATSRILGPALSRIPDGETGERTNWTRWQADVFRRSPGFREVSASASSYRKRIAFEMVPGISPGEISLGELGYAAAARRSFEVFRELKTTGIIASGTRFQVSLPTPTAVTAGYVAPEHRAAAEVMYQAALQAELSDLLTDIPSGELAIQWDVAVEIALLEGAFEAFGNWWGPPDGLMDQLVSRLCALGDSVPPAVQLGYHLCYGDVGHSHFVQPADTALLAKVADGIWRQLSRPLDFLHMPVPRQRDDPAYFAPLSGLALPAETELYLGLVHWTDGMEGALRRVDAASVIGRSFGIATECGFGRRPPDTVEDLLRLHQSVLGAARLPPPGRMRAGQVVVAYQALGPADERHRPPSHGIGALLGRGEPDDFPDRRVAFGRRRVDEEFLARVEAVAVAADPHARRAPVRAGHELGGAAGAISLMSAAAVTWGSRGPLAMGSWSVTAVTAA